MVVGFTTTCAISVYHHKRCEFKSRSRRGVLDTTLCDKVCRCLATGQWFSPCTPVSSTNKTDSHDITEILLKVALNTINLTPNPWLYSKQQSVNQYTRQQPFNNWLCGIFKYRETFKIVSRLFYLLQKRNADIFFFVVVEINHSLYVSFKYAAKR